MAIWSKKSRLIQNWIAQNVCWEDRMGSIRIFSDLIDRFKLWDRSDIRFHFLTIWRYISCDSALNSHGSIRTFWTKWPTMWIITLYDFDSFKFFCRPICRLLITVLKLERIFYDKICAIYPSFWIKLRHASFQRCCGFNSNLLFKSVV